jgi:hypothetical protein
MQKGWPRFSRATIFFFQVGNALADPVGKFHKLARACRDFAVVLQRMKQQFRVVSGSEFNDDLRLRIEYRLHHAQLPLEMSKLLIFLHYLRSGPAITADKPITCQGAKHQKSSQQAEIKGVFNEDAGRFAAGNRAGI